MLKNKKTLKALVFLMAMTALMLLPLTVNAQYREDQYGLQEWGQVGLLGKRGSGDGGDLSLQNFGENQDGLTLQNFGENAPLGSGWLVLTISGLGYTAMKTRKNKKQTKSLK